MSVWMDSSTSDAGAVSPKIQHMVVVEEIAKYFAHEFMFDEVSFNAAQCIIVLPFVYSFMSPHDVSLF